MDPIALTFYAVVCGCLSAASPRVPTLPVRLGVGAAVGLIAATVLPWIKGMIDPDTVTSYIPAGFGF